MSNDRSTSAPDRESQAENDTPADHVSQTHRKMVQSAAAGLAAAFAGTADHRRRFRHRPRGGDRVRARAM
ncbi:hypothetical protein OKW41_003676 [Paraburkholderia sp. UCT70]|uniref:hypothetical protein n=1 Tax=Paraburkholderia sp. UCT70 TaxID=2991068 RepID=UPI003D1F836B